jgi:hypothetical protein
MHDIQGNASEHRLHHRLHHGRAEAMRDIQGNVWGAALGALSKVALGAGIVLAGAYLASRIGERREADDRLSRLERLVAELKGFTPEQK